MEAFGDCVRDITGAKAISFNPGARQDGCIGLSYGGYMTGTFFADLRPYYVIAYYLEGEGACAYITSNTENLSSGYELISENIKTIIEDESVLQGTYFEGDYVDESDPYADEILGDAKYCNITPKKDFSKMRMLFTASNFEAIKNIYLRRVENNDVIYPSDNEEHEDNELVFVVDNVKSGELFKIVMFSDEDIDGIRAAAVEYEDSEAVKARNKNEEGQQTTTNY